MKNITLIALSSIFLLLEGCSNTAAKIKIKGRVQDERTAVAIPHRKIVIEVLPENQNEIPVYIGEFMTDSSGNFEYSLKLIPNVDLFNFCPVGDTVYAGSNNKLTIGQLRTFGGSLSFNLIKLTDLIINIERKSTTTFHDTLYVWWKSNKTDGKLLYPYKIKNYGIENYVNTPDVPFRWIGGDINATIKTKVCAEKETIVHWSLFRNGTITEIVDTIYCQRDIPTHLNFKY